MTETQTDSIEALLALVELAQQDLVEALSALPEAGDEALAELCREQLETIGWASDMAGLAELNAIASALLTQYDADSASLTAEQGAELVAWLGDVQLHLGAPQDPEIISLLLNPLPAQMQSEMIRVLAKQGDVSSSKTENPANIAEDDISADVVLLDDSAFDQINEHASPTDVTLIDAGLIDASMISQHTPAEFNTDGMLGMLASELHDASPELGQLAQTIASTEDADSLQQALESYRELVSRILMVSDELGLDGLIAVCRFVAHNLTLLGTLDSGARVAVCEVLQGWPGVVIAHLLQPADDVLCIAVVDYLENENWPEPLPYRDVRDLIEGLTSELEVSGDFVVEQREIEALEDDVSLDMSDDVSAELSEAFFAESPGHAEALSHLMEAISNGENIQQNVEAAQRIAHTLKGSGNLVGARGIAALAHHVEDIFEYIAKQKMTPPRALADTMQEAADTLESMLEFMQGVAPAPEDAQAVLQKVLDWANRIDSGNVRLDDLDPESPVAQRRAMAESDLGSPPDGLVDRRQSDEEKAAETVAAAAPAAAESVRVPLDVLDNMFRVVSETAIAIGQIQEHLNRLDHSDKSIRKNDSDLQQRRYELENLVSIRGMAAKHRIASADNGSDFDPLEMDVYDEFYGATHAYIEGVADSRHILREFTSEVSELNALFLLQQRLNKELQEVIMTTRMVPVGTISARLQRTVRQVCRATGKQAELLVSGEELLLDGDVLNKLADPLMHMLRNAVDHGIEATAERKVSGKPETGNISLSFRQQGNSVVVECVDDGIGLNYERIRSTAIKRGLISDQESPSNQVLARMILQSGFSTSATVTQVSGRGVGMDVVNNTIQSLKGSMQVSDGADSGTLVSLRLPITLLTSHCLLVGVGRDETFAIPTTALTQILSPGTGKIGHVGNKITYQLGKEVFTTYSLDALLGKARPAAAEALDDSSVLLVQTSDGIKAVTVDRVVSSYDLVLKNMGAYVKSLSGVAGVSILGDGSVVTVLDLPSLVEQYDSRGVRSDEGLSNTVPADAVALPKVLIVDDSLSVRSSLSQLMSDGGYQVVTARDGLEAVNMLEEEAPDVVLTDLEMPRMNGLDLLGYIRNSNQWKPLPVVMITSRTMAKHRRQAEQAGVNSYITKPFTEDEVLASVDRQLTSNSPA
jgi:chemotaxis protein histidine kinase CheA/ActR/RegA family two-component response regulator